MTSVTLECSRCGEAAVFTDWEDSDERLDALIQQELWTVSDGADLCPTCGDRDE